MSNLWWIDHLEDIGHVIQGGPGVCTEAHQILKRKIGYTGFEPNYEGFRKLIEPISSKGGKVYNLALAPECKAFKQLFIPKNYPLSATTCFNRLELNDKENHTCQIIPSITLEQAFILARQPKDVFLWLDIEGDEYEVLEDSKMVLKNNLLNIKKILVEESTKERGTYWVEDNTVKELLEECGFQKIAEGPRLGKNHRDKIYLKVA